MKKPLFHKDKGNGNLNINNSIRFYFNNNQKQRSQRLISKLKLEKNSFNGKTSWNTKFRPKSYKYKIIGKLLSYQITGKTGKLSL
jgi:hypothetical protein